MAAYDLKSLSLPKLSGLSLRLFAALLDFPLTRKLLLPGLMAQGGVTRLRALRLSTDPTLYPYAPVPEPATRPLAQAEIEATLSSARRPSSFPTIRDYSDAYRTGRFSPVQTAEKVLTAIAESEAGELPLRAFIANYREEVMRQAHASAERWRSGKPLSVLDGVPVAIKDEIDLAPYPSHVGTSFLGTAPAADCTAAARLRAAGALLVGKTNMNELGLDTSGFNAHFGTTRNPYALDRDPGGSSCGSAAATAAGLCPVSIGCDGGGSIRIPAGLCGLVGLKPTFGRVSENGAVALCPSVDAIGPIGANVEDVAIAYGIIAGPDPLDPRTRFQPPVELAGWNDPDLRGLRLGVFLPWFRHAAPEIVAACQGMLDLLVEAGARIVEIELPGLDAMRIAHAVTIVGEEAANLQDRRERIRDLGAPTRITWALSKGFTAVDYIQAQRIRTQAIATFEGAFQKVDAILSPTTAITAPPIPVKGVPHGWSDLSATTEKMRYAFQANLTGLPAISFPVGYDSDGLPIGMQAMGDYWQERGLLRIAFAAEQVVERKRPGMFFTILPEV
jgi:Asp-tRNA(Asn)/Glu-tRNA(Gln) amidotransferase A subunit family amidase